MTDGYELEALVNLYTLFHDQPLTAKGISVLVGGWDQRLAITGLQATSPEIQPDPIGYR